AKKVTWSQKAKEDRLQILNYWFERLGNKEYSKKLNARFNQTIKYIKENNYLGKSTDYENVRVSIIGHYLLFYQVTKHQIEILTIFDSRRNSNDFRLI
ncbi:MAG: type II toxin-antitoxin system RelE/ParE family toxin, partial [Ignavibacteriaceae bacterium]